ncbi:hypothetical protein SCAR479_00542 [Seiridium cardinale]|uniref:Uncharacterized protein n=1 Tax=Seiridium cardinale TaxID=138064 RepID=A0ABR2YA66_9PEZI
MPELEGSLFQLGSIRGKSLTPRKIDILNALASESANEAVRRIDGRCPSLTDTEDAADYLWAVWQVIVDVVTSPDVTSEIYEHLVSIIQGLTQVAKGELLVWTGVRRVWTDLPLFPQCMETYDKNPIAEGDELTPESLHLWRNWSSFIARCMDGAVLGMYVQQIDALRGALEEELDIERDMAKTECQLQVAFEWITHTARNLLWWAQENIGLVDVANDSTQYFPGGPLYQGPPCVCLRRWGFWQARFEELGKHPGLSEEIRKAALRAAETMTTVEKRIANIV